MGDQKLPKTMRAWLITSRGPPGRVLKLKDDVSAPILTSNTSVLIRISHASPHPGTSLLVHIAPMLFRKSPAVAETDFSGTVVATGNNLTVASSHVDYQSFPVGTTVFGSIPVPAHLKGSGALADYVVADVQDIARVPKNITSAEASCLSVSAITAMDVVNLACLKPGSRVLINAPCGGIGAFATQLVRHAVGREGRIVGLCSGVNKQLAKDLGCDHAVDYRPDCDGLSITTRLRRDGVLYDAIIDCYGSQELWDNCENYLKLDGIYATVGPKFPSMSYFGMFSILCSMMRNMLIPAWLGGVRRSYKQAASFINKEKLERVRKLAEVGIIKPHIGKEYGFENIQEAYANLMDGHAQGKIVIKIEE